MSFKFVATAAALVLSAGIASAQNAQPAQPARPATPAVPPVAAPAAPPKVTAPAPAPAKTTAPAPAAKAEPLVNLNTASASDLDKLPQIGEKRAADIIAKRPYKDWNDFVAKNVVPANAEAAIKDKVKFR